MWSVRRITFTLLQNYADANSTYRCATGTMVCRNLNDSGQVVSSSVAGSLVRLRVMTPEDLSSCIFDARSSLNSGEERQWKRAGLGGVSTRDGIGGPL